MLLNNSQHGMLMFTENYSHLKNEMELLDVLPKKIKSFVNYCDYGFSHHEITSIASQYAAGKTPVDDMLRQMKRYVVRKLNAPQ